MFCSYAQDTSSVKKKKPKSITAIPIVSYNRSYGFIAAVSTLGFFKLSKTDSVSPESQAGVAGGYTQNKSWFVSGFTRLYVNDDKWRFTFAAATGKVNFQYFESDGDTEEGNFADYSNVNKLIFLKGLRKIHGHLYGGLFLKFQHSDTEFEGDSSQQVNTNSIGLSMLYDSRNDVYYPSKGLQVSLNLADNAKWLGSDSLFSSLKAYANYYRRVTHNSILASRLSFYTGLGDVPFVGQHTVGGKDIRGYSNGKYRGNQVYAVQAEYRWNFYKRWGAVGFFGLAFTESPYSGILPGGGVGARFKVFRSRNINIGIDGALGKNDHGIYFRIGEAF
ncbi:BamA/TamA family outer membrane protein [Pedobacter sp. HMF7647]|uniref:BamA/TamA family outer membrane protein n=1 Tax=Hufsiella arboris TaxID=2695275 RepID=A0A7K1Y994_9SPHI|nr:BamA/TamA family outer membrane protein [Hufsiella arboris]MXV51162.1 BamA/TamA family outer membrane protein [Hufsiella arboris]